MKKVIRLSLATLLISTLAIFSVQAQRGPGKGHGHGHGFGNGYGPDSCHLQLRINKLAEKVGLSEKQEQEILELHYAHMGEVKAMRAEYKNDCVGEKEAHIASRKKLEESTEKVMNDEQLVKYKEFKDEWRRPHDRQHRHKKW